MSETQISNGSVWRERDARFSRFVRVVDVDCGDGKLAVRTCDDLGRFISDRPTRVSRSRFPRAFDKLPGYA